MSGALCALCGGHYIKVAYIDSGEYAVWWACENNVQANDIECDNDEPNHDLPEINTSDVRTCSDLRMLGIYLLD